MAVYSSGSQLEWREVEGGELPSPRYELTATLGRTFAHTFGRMSATIVEETLYVSGGGILSSPGGTSILSWNPEAESWQPAGDLAVARDYHAAVAVPASLVEC